jgi:antitoxin component YwqK of YwqJK toxin-antitoxin module
MKKIIFYLFIINLLISCTKRLNEKEVHMGSDGLIYHNGNKYTGEVFDVYKHGRKKIEMIVNNGKLNGTKTKWYENGNLLSVENYIDNIKNGQFLKYSENGELICEENYKKDVKHGYFENVQIGRKQIINYVDGKRNGYCKYVSTYGDAEGNYKEDYEDGIWKYYDYYKRLEKEISFKKGKKNGLSVIYNPLTGEVLEKIMFKNNIHIDTKNQIVKTVKIGDQVWMSENLRTNFYQNGDEINFH